MYVLEHQKIFSSQCVHVQSTNILTFSDTLMRTKYICILNQLQLALH